MQDDEAEACVRDNRRIGYGIVNARVLNFISKHFSRKTKLQAMLLVGGPILHQLALFQPRHVRPAIFGVAPSAPDPFKKTGCPRSGQKRAEYVNEEMGQP